MLKCERRGERRARRDKRGKRVKRLGRKPEGGSRRGKTSIMPLVIHPIMHPVMHLDLSGNLSGDLSCDWWGDWWGRLVGWELSLAAKGSARNGRYPAGIPDFSPVSEKHHLHAGVVRAGMVQAWSAWFYSVALKRMGPPPSSRGRKYPFIQSGFRMQIWT